MIILLFLFSRGYTVLNLTHVFSTGVQRVPCSVRNTRVINTEKNLSKIFGRGRILTILLRCKTPF